MAAFLQSLEPVASLESLGHGSLERVVQLIAKTNQFKLNPRTFTAEELVAVHDGVFALRLRDRLQDYGIVAVVVTRFENDELLIANWVMSCRVFARRLEHATLELLRAHGRERGVAAIRAIFQDSPKNSVARTILIELGFEEEASGNFILPIASAREVLPHFMRIEHSQPASGEST
jgi:FkbH-like protein